MHKHLIPLVVCPLCKAPLQYRRGAKEMVCNVDKIVFPVRKGVPVLLEMDAHKLQSK